MINNFEEIQKFNKDNMDVAMKSFGTVSKTFQAIATEVTDYSKKSFEDGTAALEKLMSAKSVEKAIEVQTDFVKSAYEGFVAEATKLGDMYSDLAKETYKPIEGLMAKAKAAA
jgi:phasin family protein